MFEVRENVECIHGVPFQTFEREVGEKEVWFRIEAGTTGLCGDGNEERSRAFFQIRNGNAKMASSLLKGEDDTPFGFAFHVRGDNEVLALSKALAFASQVLREQIHKTNR